MKSERTNHFIDLPRKGQKYSFFVAGQLHLATEICDAIAGILYCSLATTQTHVRKWVWPARLHQDAYIGRAIVKATFTTSNEVSLIQSRQSACL